MLRGWRGAKFYCEIHTDETKKNTEDTRTSTKKKHKTHVFLKKSHGWHMDTTTDMKIRTTHDLVCLGLSVWFVCSVRSTIRSCLRVAHKLPSFSVWVCLVCLLCLCGSSALSIRLFGHVCVVLAPLARPVGPPCPAHLHVASACLSNLRATNIYSRRSK